MNEQDKAKLRQMSASLNRWANDVLAGRKVKQPRRLSYAAALREADKCRLRMKVFGHY